MPTLTLDQPIRATCTKLNSKACSGVYCDVAKRHRRGVISKKKKFRANVEILLENPRG